MSEAGSFEEYSHFFQVKLDIFDGPIDLLLHLVKQNELPLEKVSLAQVAQQYLGCIEMMRQYDLEIAGEYLVIAATLLSIKSSIMLNEPVQFVTDADGNLVNPHDELLRRLREAEVYKEGAFILGSQKLLGVDVFSAPASLDGVPEPPVRYMDHDPMLLGKAFRKLLLKAGEEPKFFITVDPVSIVERMVAVLDILNKAKEQGQAQVRFESLIPDLTSRMSIIGTLIALLELCKRQAIHVEQKELSDDIFITGTGFELHSTGLVSEFDQPADYESDDDLSEMANG
jgi:segregation and condensation protein A